MSCRWSNHDTVCLLRLYQMTPNPPPLLWLSKRNLLRVLLLQASWSLWMTSTSLGAACWWLRPPSASSMPLCSLSSALTACWPGRGSDWLTVWRTPERSGRRFSPDITQVRFQWCQLRQAVVEFWGLIQNQSKPQIWKNSCQITF